MAYEGDRGGRKEIERDRGSRKEIEGVRGQMFLCVYRRFFLCISKLNRTFDCVEGTSPWMYKTKCKHFSCVSQNLIVPLQRVNSKH